MTPKLYKTDESPPVRAVNLAAGALGITLDTEDISLRKKEQHNPEYLKLNPQHTIPTLEDEGKSIWDSHAIMIYLVEKYGKDDSLYPNDPYTRAMVNQRLHFDSGVLFAHLRAIVRPMLYKGVKSIPENLKEEVEIAYEFLEKFLEGHNWAVGDNVTVADFSLLASTTSLDTLLPIHSNKYPNITAWIKRAQQLPYYSGNQKGLDIFRAHAKELLKG